VRNNSKLSDDGILRVGLVGKMRAGKDEVAKYLWLDHGFEYPLAFGNALKRFAHEIFPDVPKNPKPRELYQFMNVMRDFDEDVWVKHLNQSYESDISYRQTKGVVVSDARQENEIKWLKDNGFTLVKVEASEALRKQRAKREGDDVTGEQFEHRTEQFVDNVAVDYIIVNDGTLDELYRKVDEVMAKIKSN